MPKIFITHTSNIRVAILYKFYFVLWKNQNYGGFVVRQEHVIILVVSLDFFSSSNAHFFSSGRSDLFRLYKFQQYVFK